MTQRLPQPFGRYTLVRLIGEGGMAEVYQANVRVAEGLTKWVVIKKIRKDFVSQGEFTRMFVEEAKIALSLTHANIVQVFDFGQIGSAFYLAMELIEGIDLMALFHAVKARGEHFPPEIAAYIAQQVAAGLSYVHRKTDDFGQPLGIVHRDVTPHNIMLSFDGQVKVLDFGIARAASTRNPPNHRAEQETIKGKVAYMSPEQALGRPIDGRSDVYSLAVVLYELLTGSLIYRDRDRVRALERVRQESLAPLAELAPELPPDLTRALDRALARDVDERTGSAREFQTQLASFVHRSGEVVDDATLSDFILRYRKREFSPAVRAQAQLDPATAEVDVGEASSPVLAPNRQIVRAVILHASFGQANAGGSVKPADLQRYLEVVRDLAFKRDAQLVELSEQQALLAFSLLPSPQDDADRALRTAMSMRELISDMAPGLALGVILASTQVTLTRNVDGVESVYLPPELRHLLSTTSASYLDSRVMVSRELSERLGKSWRFGLPALAQSALADESTYAPWLADIQELAPFLGPLSESERRVYLNVGGRRPLYGRDLELKTLRDSLADVIRRSISRSILVVGGPGYGKRTLLDRFLASLPSGGFVPLRGVGLWVYRNQPYGVLLDVLRRFFGVQSQTQASDLVQKIQDLGIQEPELLGRFLAGTLGLVGSENAQAEPPEGRNLVVRLLRRLIRALASRRPVLLVVENLHFCDEQSLALLEEWARNPQHYHVLGLFTVRPASRAESLFSTAEVTRIELGELDEVARRELILRRFEHPEEAQELASKILAQTGGNPLFIEETLASLLRREVIGWNAQGRQLRLQDKEAIIEVLPSIEAALGERIDALDPPARSVLQAAAVLGRRFRPNELPALVDAQEIAVPLALEQLLEERLIEREANLGPNGVERMRFSTVSLHEVCRASIAAAFAKQLHARAAQIKSKRIDYKPGRDDGPLAEHLTHAGLIAASIEPALRAAQHAQENAGNVEAYYYLSHIIKSLPEADERRFRALLERERILRAWARTRAQGADVRQIVSFADNHGNAEHRVIATLRLIRFYVECGRLHRAERMIPNVEQWIGELEDGQRYRPIYGELQSNIAFGRHDYAGAQQLARDALESCSDEPDGQRLRGRLLTCVGLAQMGHGKFSESGATFQTVLELSRQINNRRLEAESLNHLGSVAGLSTNYQDAVDYYRQALAIDRELGDRYATGNKLANLGIAYTAIGLYSKAERYLRKAMELHEQVGHPGLLNDVMINLGDALLGLGDNEGAREQYREAARVARTRQDRRREMRADVKFAFSMLTDDATPAQLEEAREIATRVAAGSRGLGSQTSAVRGLYVLARIAEREGDFDAAVALERDAVNLVQAGAAPVEGVMAVHHLGKLLQREPTTVIEGEQLLQDAAQVVWQRLERLRDPEMRRGYTDQSIVRRILEDGGRSSYAPEA